MTSSEHASDCLQIVQWILVGSLVTRNLTLFDLSGMPVSRLINYFVMCNNRTHDVVKEGLPPWAEAGNVTAPRHCLLLLYICLSTPLYFLN